MLRAVVGSHRETAGDWVAELDCGHAQHARHEPSLGTSLTCAACDRFEVPDDFLPYQRTRDFDEGSIPQGLRQHHSTRSGVWGVIHVLSGRLRYVVEAPLACERWLDEAHPGVVVPEVLHRVEAHGPVRFFVEFRRKGQSV